MGRVLQALRQLECKQGSPSSAGSATAQPPDISRQAVVPDDDLAPPPEYLPDGLALRQEPSLSSGGETSVGSDVGRIGNPSSNETVAADNAPPRGAYDELAETILAQIVPGRPAALCFTSVEEGIGRTAMVASLAAALARREPQGVLAVDADFRQPRLGSHFGVLPDPGLAGVLGGRTGWEEAIAATEIPSLFVLPAGRSDWEEKGDSPHLCEAPGTGQRLVGRAPTEGLSRQMGTVPFFPADRLAPLLEQWHGRFRLVLFDAPWLIRPGADCLARHFDGVYLALRLGETRKRALRRALHALEAAGGRLLGSILLGPPLPG